MPLISRIAFLLTVISVCVAYLVPNWRGVATAFTVIAALLLWITREVGHSRNQQLRSQIAQQAGSIGDLGGKVEKNRPELKTAAAIAGQGELATWNYEKLVQRMKEDGYIRSA